MLNRHGAGLVLCAWALATPALAQPAGNVVELNIHTPKPGQEAKYEAGRKKHMAWHKAQKDTWTWFTCSSWSTGVRGRCSSTPPVEPAGRHLPPTTRRSTS